MLIDIKRKCPILQGPTCPTNPVEAAIMVMPGGPTAERCSVGAVTAVWGLGHGFVSITCISDNQNGCYEVALVPL